jgi:diketogulonate reductase-like aldo/keto reductase
MRYRDFGPTGRQVAVIGQGTWNLERGSRGEAVEALRQGLDAGMTHIDTAEMYGGGRVEEMVGEAIAGRRDEVFLVSKVLPQNASRRGVVQACERSLAHLRTDRLDVYLLHWPSRYPLEDTFAAFEDLAQAGKIDAWGVSNFDVEDLERAVGIAGPRKIACNQVLYHLEERAIEHAVLPFCERHGIAVVAYSPFGSGRFPSPRSRGGQVLAEIAEARGATPHQIALAFLTRRSSLFAIPKASQSRHALDNAAAGDLELTADEIVRLDDAFPIGSRRELPTL